MDSIAAHSKASGEVKEKHSSLIPAVSDAQSATQLSEKPTLSSRTVQTPPKKLQAELEKFAVTDSGKPVVPEIKAPNPEYERVLVRLLILLGMNWSQERARHALLLAAALGQTSTVNVLLRGKVFPDQVCQIKSFQDALEACDEIEEKMARNMRPKPARRRGDTDVDVDISVPHYRNFFANSVFECDMSDSEFGFHEGDDRRKYNPKKSAITPLMCAAAFGYSEIVDALLSANALPDHSEVIVQALTCALIGGHIEIAKNLLQKDASAEGSLGNSEFFPLSIAAGLNDPALVGNLLEKKADTGRLMPSGKSSLFNAVLAKRTKIVHMLIQAGAKVNEIPGERCSMLMFAALLGHASAVSMLLEAGAKANYVNAEGVGALTLAIQNGHAEVASLLVDAGASCHEQDRLGRSAVYFAALGGHAEILKILHARGAQLEAPGGCIYSPLHAAAANGHLDAVEMLLGAGANVHRHSAIEGTALMAAAKNGKADVVRRLLAGGAHAGYLDENDTGALLCAAGSGDVTSVKLLLEAGSALEAENYLGQFPLLAAAKAGHTEVVKFLLENHVAVDTKNRFGETALLASAATGKLETVTLLLFSGAKVSQVNGQGRSALALAAQGGFLKVVELLYDYEESSKAENPDHEVNLLNPSILNQRDDTGMTPLMLAAEIKNVRKTVSPGFFWHRRPATEEIKETPMLAWLIQHGADVLISDYLQRDALMLAAKAGNAEGVKLLMEAGASCDRRDFQGRSVLMYAAQAEDMLAPTDFISEKTPVDLEDQTGHTALMLAAASNFYQNCSTLIKAGADVNHVSELLQGRNALMVAVESNAMNSAIRLIMSPTNIDHLDKKKISCLMLAAKGGYEYIVEILLQKGANVFRDLNTGMNAYLLAAEAGHDRVIDAFAKFSRSNAIPVKSPIPMSPDELEKAACIREKFLKDRFLDDPTAMQIALKSNHSNALAALIFHRAVLLPGWLLKAIENRAPHDVIDILLFAQQLFAQRTANKEPGEITATVPIPVQGGNTLLTDMFDLMQGILLEEMTEESLGVFRQNALTMLCNVHKISSLLSISIVEGLVSMIGYQQDLANAGALPSDAQLRLCCAFVLNSAQNLHMVLTDEVSSLAAYGLTPDNEESLNKPWHLHKQLHIVAKHQAQEIIALGENEIKAFSSTFEQALAKTKTYNQAGVFSHLTRVLGLNPLLAGIVAATWVANRSQQNPELAFAIALEKALQQKKVLDQLESDQSEILRGFFMMQADCLYAYCASKIPAPEKAVH